MELITQVWQELLQDLLTERLSFYLTKDEIDKKIDYVIHNFSSFSAETLYKNCVYLSKNTEITYLCTDYCIKLLNDFEKTFSDPSTVELDDNKYLTDNYREILKKHVKDQMIAYNHYVEEIINCKKVSFLCSRNSISSFFKLDEINSYQEVWVSNNYCNDNGECSDSEVLTLMNIRDIIYSYNYGELNGKCLTKKSKSTVENTFYNKILISKPLTDKYPDGFKDYLKLI